MTPLTIEPPPLPLEHAEPVMFVGSCFAVNLAHYFRKNLFDVHENPFGIIYDPLSIERAMTRIAENQPYLPEELTEFRGHYVSFDHHGEFTGDDPGTALAAINERLSSARHFLEKAGSIFITLGTSSVFFREDRPVANCHRLPQQEFTRRRLSAGETTSSLARTVEKIRTVNPLIRIIMTVSPVRHLRDGLVENSRNKARLIAALGDLLERDRGIGYFPSYEIMLDELRDYRFYAEDMLHPSGQAVNYLWEKLSETYFSAHCSKVLADCETVISAREHRPINPESVEYRQFRESMVERIRQLGVTYPHLDLRALLLEFEA